MRAARQTFVGKTQESIFLALEDGRFERQEFEDIRRRGFEHMGKFLELLNRLEGLIYD